mmetsp:Transcript_134493/g.335517  ORF Transcript_134493/g.335517 Transcript_134493/m.335517 type:complete len:342 (-) Transcript_134493:538-1563(-)
MGVRMVVLSKTRRLQREPQSAVDLLDIRVCIGEDVPEGRVHGDGVTRSHGVVAPLAIGCPRRIRGVECVVPPEHALDEGLSLCHDRLVAQHFGKPVEVCVVLHGAVQSCVGREVAHVALSGARLAVSEARGHRAEDVPGDRRVARGARRGRIVREGERRPGVVSRVDAAVGDERRLVVPGLGSVRLVEGGRQQRDDPPRCDASVLRLRRIRLEGRRVCRVQDLDKRIQDDFRLGQAASLHVVECCQGAVVGVVAALRVTLRAGARDIAAAAAGAAAEGLWRPNLQELEVPGLGVQEGIDDEEARLLVRATIWSDDWTVLRDGILRHHWRLPDRRCSWHHRR